MRDNRVKIIILVLLALLLAVVVFLLVRGCSRQEKTVAGANVETTMEILDLLTPLNVIADESGNIFVSNTGKGEVDVFDPDGNLMYKIDSGEEKDGAGFQLYSPYGLAIDEENNRLYVADYELRVFDKQGNYLYKISPPP